MGVGVKVTVGAGVREGVNVGIRVDVWVGRGVSLGGCALGEEARRRGGGREVEVLVGVATGEVVASGVASVEAMIGLLLQAVSRLMSVIRDN